MSYPLPVFGVVYLFTNLSNGKKYVGQTTSYLSDRLYGHFYTSRDPKNSRYNNPLYCSLRKRGKEGYSISILCSCSSQQELDLLEDLYILAFDTMNLNKGYNLQRGGSRGKMSERSKSLMSSQRVGKKNSRYRHDIDEEGLKIRYLRGDTLKSMCSSLNISSLFIEQRMKAMGVVLRPSGHPPMTAAEKEAVGLRMKIRNRGNNNPAFRSDITEKCVLGLYFSGKTIGNIAKELSADYGTVAKRIKDAGIKLKSGPRPKNAKSVTNPWSAALSSNEIRPPVYI